MSNPQVQPGYLTFGWILSQQFQSAQAACGRVIWRQWSTGSPIGPRSRGERSAKCRVLSSPRRKARLSASDSTPFAIFVPLMNQKGKCSGSTNRAARANAARSWLNGNQEMTSSPKIIKSLTEPSSVWAFPSANLNITAIFPVLPTRNSASTVSASFKVSV